MSTFMFKKFTSDYTPVSNIFIERYMPKARGEFVKVYLLALKYCLYGEPGVNSALMASALHLLESDIMNAWNYWNDEGVIRFTPIDRMGNFNIEFLDLTEDTSKEGKEVNLLEELTNNSTKDMLHEIEKLVARPLASKEMSTYIGWQKDFNFSPEIILLIIEYCASRGKCDYRYIEKVAIAWYDANITTIEQAQSFIKKHEDKWIKYKKILSYLGIKDGEIMKPQEDLLDKWVNGFVLPVEVIMKACDICFERLSRADFKYIDAILTSWNKDGIKSIEEIQSKDKKSTFKKAASQKGQNDNFNNFEQRVYDYDSLEKRLLGWDKQ
ncbi:MAG: DnaD domain protein [Bacillota bacterium]|nr:DnaD domain protein [Bacillota bacterium]